MFCNLVDKRFLKFLNLIDTSLITNVHLLNVITNVHLPNIILEMQIFHQRHHGQDNNPSFFTVIRLVHGPFDLICSVHFLATAFAWLLSYGWYVFVVYCSTSMFTLDCYAIW